MTSLQYVKAEDHVEPLGVTDAGRTLHLDRLPGVWLNTNSDSRGIVKVIVQTREDRLFVRTFGADGAAPRDWGEVEADYLYASSISADMAAGFSARYRLGFSEIHLQANWNQGLLVLASFTTFIDSSKRSNYFSREFFHQQD
jgi:hypothetical protein